MNNEPLNFFITSLVLGQVENYGERLKKLRDVLNLKEKSLITGRTISDLKTELEKAGFKQINVDIFSRIEDISITVAYVEDLCSDIKNIRFIYNGSDGFDPVEGLSIIDDEVKYAELIDILKSLNDEEGTWRRYCKSWNFMNIQHHSLFTDKTRLMAQVIYGDDPRFIVKYPGYEDILIVVTEQIEHSSVFTDYCTGVFTSLWNVDVLVKKGRETPINEESILKFLTGFITESQFFILETVGQDTVLIPIEENHDYSIPCGTEGLDASGCRIIKYPESKFEITAKETIPEPITKPESFISKIIKSILGTK